MKILFSIILVALRTFPYFQNLAFLDLCRLSQYDKKRRLQLYSLSIPGRHPVYWQALVGECLSQLDRHVSTLSSHVYSVLDGSYMQTVGERMAGRNRGEI